MAFGDWREEETPNLSLKKKDIKRSSPQKERVRFFDIEKPRLKLGWRTCRLLSEDTAALDVLDTLLGGGKGSYLHQSYVEKGIYQQIETSSWTPSEEGSFEIQIIDAGDLGKVSPLRMHQEIEHFIATLKGDRLNSAKKKIYQDLIHSLDSTAGMCHNLASNETYTGKPDFDIHYLDKVLSVDRKKINEVFIRYFSPEKMIQALYLPKKMKKKRLPILSKNGNTLKNKATLTSASWAKKRGGKKLASVFKRIQSTTGTRIVFKKRPSQLIHGSLVFQGGLEWETTAKHGQFNLLAKMLLEGTKRKSSKQITACFENQGNLIVAFSSESAYGLTFSFFKQDEKEMNALLSELISESTFAANRMKCIKERIRGELVLDKENIWEEHTRLFKRSLFQNSILAEDIRGNGQTLDKITSSDLKTLHQQHSCAGNAALCLIGPAKKELARELAKNLPQGNLKKDPPSPWQRDILLKKIVKKSLDKDQTIYRMAFWGASFKNDDIRYLDLLSYYFSGMGGPLFKLRESTGDAYEISCSHLVRRSYGVFIFTIALAAHSQRTELWFMGEIFSMLNKIKKKKVPIDEIGRAVASFKGAKAVAMQAYPEQSAQVALYELFGLGYETYLNESNFENQDLYFLLDKLSFIANHYFKEDRYLVVGAGAKI